MAQVEALAAKRAMEFALEVGINCATFEGDFVVIFIDLMNREPFLALHGHLIQYVKILFPLFSFISFSHFRHQGNNVAHSLSKGQLLRPI